MKEEKLKELLVRYYSGDTTSEEEFLLKEYFSGDDILPGYEAEKEIFRYYSTYERITAPSGKLESRILDAIDRFDEKQKLKSAFFERNRLIILSVAASLLILIGSYFFFLIKSEPKDTYDDPQIAYAVTKQILYNMSVNLNKGAEAMQHVSGTARTGLESIEQAANRISSQIGIVKNLDKIPKNGNRKK